MILANTAYFWQKYSIYTVHNSGKNTVYTLCIILANPTQMHRNNELALLLAWTLS